MIMLDLDFIDFNKNEFYNMFNIINNNTNINGIFGVSILKNNTNCIYDIGAITSYVHILLIRNDEDILIKVTSAFSGFGIYRMQSLINNNIEYNVKTNEIEHIDFNKNINNLYVYTLFRPVYEGDCNDCYFYKGIIKYYMGAFTVFIIILIALIVYFYKKDEKY
jgi:hypothetical protein